MRHVPQPHLDAAAMDALRDDRRTAVSILSEASVVSTPSVLAPGRPKSPAPYPGAPTLRPREGGRNPRARTGCSAIHSAHLLAMRGLSCSELPDSLPAMSRHAPDRRRLVLTVLLQGVFALAQPSPLVPTTAATRRSVKHPLRPTSLHRLRR